MFRVCTSFCIGLALFLVGSAVAQASPAPPSVVSESSYSITASDATLEALIEPGGSPDGTDAQFQLAENPSEFPEDITCPSPNPRPYIPCEGTTSTSALPIQGVGPDEELGRVKLHLADAGVTLKPNTTYYFRIVAANHILTEDTFSWERPVVVGQTKSFITRETSPANVPPSIIGESASGITTADATLEADIDPGAGAYYQFELAAGPEELSNELFCPPPPVLSMTSCGGPQSATALPIGEVPAGGHVELDLADAGVALEPDKTYYFNVVAAAILPSANRLEFEEPVVAGEEVSFTTPPLPPPPPSPSGSGSSGSSVTDPAPVEPSLPPPPHKHHPHHPPRRHSSPWISRARIAR